jgi:hypothetical protein
VPDTGVEPADGHRVSGVFGLAAGDTRVVLAVREADDGRGFTRSVGDGRRHLVPAAAGPDGRWGSDAAEHWLATRPEGATPAGSLTGWRVDPSSTPFLRGVAERLTAYLGRTTPSSPAWEICVAAPEPDHGTLRSRAREAGLPAVTTLVATDALVSRWCTEPGAALPASGRVVAVVCGQATTEVALYHAQLGADRPRFSRRASTRLPVGTGAAEIELARRVLQRCAEGVPVRAALPVLDGTVEFAAALRETAVDEEIAWSGSLAGRMFSPLRLGPRAVVEWPALRGLASAVTAEVRRQLDADADAQHSLVLLGGLGAQWPVEGPLRRIAPVWRSRSPVHDIAMGATYWPALRVLFEAASTGDHAPVRPKEVAARASGPVTPPPATPARAEPVDPDSVPPWKRHLIEP